MFEASEEMTSEKCVEMLRIIIETLEDYLEDEGYEEEVGVPDIFCWWSRCGQADA